MQSDSENMTVDITGENHKVRMRNHKLSITCLCVDPEAKFAFTASKDGSIIKWCLSSMKIIQKVNGTGLSKDIESKAEDKKKHIRHINCIAISSNNKFLATGGWDMIIRIWSPEDLTWIHSFEKHRKQVTALAFRQDHDTLYSGSDDRSVMLWSLEEDDNRCFVEALYGHESPITSMDSLRRERILTAGGRDQSVRIWKIVEQAQTVYQSRHESVDVVRFIDDKTFVSGGEDGCINVWTTLKRSPVATLTKIHGKSNDAIKTSVENWISAISVFTLKSTKESKVTKKRRTNDTEDLMVASKFDDYDEEQDSNDDDEETQTSGVSGTMALIASGSCDSHIKIWKLEKSGSKYELKLHQKIDCSGFVNDLKFTSDGKKLLAACGPEHKFGRWTRLRNAKNRLHVFDVDKLV